jgi:hypothetical protein
MSGQDLILDNFFDLIYPRLELILKILAKVTPILAQVMLKSVGPGRKKLALGQTLAYLAAASAT